MLTRRRAAGRLFRQPWIAQQLKQGDRLAVMGKVEFAYGFKQMASPHFEKLEDGAPPAPSCRFTT